MSRLSRTDDHLPTEDSAPANDGGKKSDNVYTNYMSNIFITEEKKILEKLTHVCSLTFQKIVSYTVYYHYFFLPQCISALNNLPSPEINFLMGGPLRL